MNAETCDHVVGMGSESWGGELLASERERIAIACQVDVQRWLDGRTGVPWAVALAQEAVKTPEAALAHTFDLYAYCPRCGARLVQP